MNSEELYKELMEALEEPPKMIDDTIHDTPYRPKVKFEILSNKPRICCIRNRLGRG